MEHSGTQAVCSYIKKLERCFASLRRTGKKESGRNNLFKGTLVHADINNKTYNTKMPLCKSYELLRQKHIVFDDILPKWNYVVKYMAAE